MAMLILLLAAELSVRVFDLWQNTTIARASALDELKWLPGSKWQGRTINRLGYWDDEFDGRPRAGTFRIAALGHSLALSGSAENNCLVQVEHRVPRLDVFNFGLRGAGPREFVAQAGADVWTHRPDLVLVFLSIGDDDAPQTTTSDAPWWKPRLASVARRGSPTNYATSANAPDPHELRLRRGVRQMRICRIPQDAQQRGDWRAASKHLESLLAECRDRGVELAMVLVPADFQLNSRLRDAIVRRSGGEASDYDFELPQRRWTRFAEQRNIALLDLLPSLRAARQPVYSPDAADFSDPGLTLASATLGDWLRVRYEPAISATAQAGRGATPVP
ncbi:MAG TPA: hypothetical protein VG713_00945 [Pirellulales bacterium]|nr:hypothetical protein [Pirellulales bacterium]